MRQVRGWLYWTPFPRGTWHHVALYGGSLAVTLSIFELIVGFEAQWWLGSMIGLAVAALVLSTPAVVRSRRAKPN
jgi:hypothetical protein